MPSSSLSLVSAALALLALPAAAQTFTGCNPLNATCPPNRALGTSHTWNMSAPSSATFDDADVWNATGGRPQYGRDFAAFSVERKGDSPAVASNFYVFWGSVSTVVKAAPGRGIVSSVVLQSSDLDEVDWEWIGSNNTHVQTNYFGKGNNQTFDRNTWVPVDDPQNKWHNYTTVWTSSQLEWWIDGKQVRTLPFAKADGAGEFYPQTPVDVRLGIWAGGDSDSNGTVQWAGGHVDYSQAPFTMQVQSLTVNDGTTNASSYTYGDRSGKFQSIKVEKGQSDITNKLVNPPPSVADRFNGLPTGAKVGIAVGAAAFAAVLLGSCAFCCLRQRRAGRREKALEDARWERSTTELMAYREKMATGRFARGNDRGAAGEKKGGAAVSVRSLGSPGASIGAGGFGRGPGVRSPALPSPSFRYPGGAF